MKDIYFIAGVGIGMLAGMIVMYKSKMAKEIASTCEHGIEQTAKNVKEKVEEGSKQPKQKLNKNGK